MLRIVNTKIRKEGMRKEVGSWKKTQTAKLTDRLAVCYRADGEEINSEVSSLKHWRHMETALHANGLRV